MKRLSTRRKRLLGLTNTHLMHRYALSKATPKSRMKSFATEEKAQAWAKAEGLDIAKHELRHHTIGKKWQWHPKR